MVYCLKSSPDGCERLAEGERFLVVFGLYAVAVSHLEVRTADEAGTALQGEGHGDGVDEFAVAII